MAKKKIEVDLLAYDKMSKVFDTVNKNTVSAFKTIDTSISSFNNKLRHYNSSMYEFNRGVVGAMNFAKDAVLDFTTTSAKAFGDFESQHSATMGAMAADYDRTAAAQKRFMEDQKKMSDQAIRLGKFGPTGNGSLYEPKDISKAQESLVKSGVKPDDIYGSDDMLNAIIKFSAGNKLPLDTSTDFAVSLGTQFNIDPSGWGDMLDKVTRAADISIIEIGDIIQSMKYASGITASMDRPLEEVLGILATLGNAGLKGSIAGSGVQAFFTRLLTTNGDIGEKMAGAAPGNSAAIFTAFRNAVTDKDGNLINMDNVSEMLDQAYSVMNDEEAAWFSKRLFGLYQMKTGFAMSKHGEDGSNMLEDNTNAIRSTYKGANDLKYQFELASQSGKLEALRNIWSSINVDFGERMSPMVKAVADELYEFLRDNKNYKDIDFSRLKDAINESGDLIGENYGDTISNIFRQVATMGLDGSRIGVAVAPTAGGVVGFLTELMSGNGWESAWNTLIDNINDTNENIDDLPPELQGMATAVKDAILAIAAISGMNIAAKILETGTTIVRYAIMPLITLIGTELTKGFAKLFGAEELVEKVTKKVKTVSTMTVNAGVVNVNGKAGGTTPVIAGKGGKGSTAPKSGGTWSKKTGIGIMDSLMLAGVAVSLSDDMKHSSMDELYRFAQGLQPGDIENDPFDKNRQKLNNMVSSVRIGGSIFDNSDDDEYWNSINAELARIGYSYKINDHNGLWESFSLEPLSNLSPSAVDRMFGDKKDEIAPDSAIILEEINKVNSAIAQFGNPSINLNPNLTVNVQVDKDGNVTKQEVIPDYKPWQEWYSKESNRYGK